MMVLIYIKKHLRNIRGSFHEIEGKLKKVFLIKKRVFQPEKYLRNYVDIFIKTCLYCIPYKSPGIN